MWVLPTKCLVPLGLNLRSRIDSNPSIVKYTDGEVAGVADVCGMLTAIIQTVVKRRRQRAHRQVLRHRSVDLATTHGFGILFAWLALVGLASAQSTGAVATWNAFVEAAGTSPLDVKGLSLRSLKRRFGAPDSRVDVIPAGKRITMYWGCTQMGAPLTCAVVADFYETDAPSGRVRENAVPVRFTVQEIGSQTEGFTPIRTSIFGLRLNDPVTNAITASRRTGREVFKVADSTFSNIDVPDHTWGVDWHARADRIDKLTLRNKNYIIFPGGG